MIKLLIILVSFNLVYGFELPRVINVLVRDPKPIIGVLGRDSLIVECVTQGDVTDFVWMFNGTEVKSSGQYRLRQKNSILLVDEVQYKNNGQYQCIASNSIGSVFGEKNIQLSAVGEFHDGFGAKDGKKEVSAVLGEPLTMPCPPHKEGQGQIYFWGDLPGHSIPIIWRAGDPIKRAFVGKHGALMFSYLKPSDIEEVAKLGGISCILYQEKVAIQSVKYVIKSEGTPVNRNFAPSLKAFMDEQFLAVEGEKKTILCGATGRPHPTISWYKDNKLIYNGETKEKFMDNITMSGEDMELNMFSVSKSDEGKYKCVAKNTVGSDEKEGMMTVHTKPKWLKELKQGMTSVLYESPVILHCNASGIPLVRYAWYHNNTEMKPNERVKIEGGVLTVSNSGFPDSGVYMCVARNYLKTIVSATYVDIQAIPPSFHGRVANPTYFFINYTNTLHCNATAGPPPMKTWYKENVEITSSDRLTLFNNATLTIARSTLSDAGKFKCVAKNEKGLAERIVNVRVVEKTVITNPPSNIAYKEGHPLVHLFCNATYEKTLHVTFEWLKDGQAINFNEHVYLENRVSGPSKIISFRNLSLTDAGKYSCRVYTTDGKNVVSEDIRHGYVGVVAKPKAPVGVKVNGDCSTFVNTYISWQPSQIFVAPVKDYVIEYAVISSPKRWYRYDPEHTMTASTTIPLLKSKLPPSAKLMFRVIAVASYNGEELMSEPSILVDKVVYRTGFRTCVTPYGPPIANPSNVQIRWLPQYNALDIVWDQIDSVHRVDGHIVGYRKLSNDTKFINKTIDGNSNTFWITNPGFREKFEIFVRSKNSRGVGPEPKIHVGSSGGPAITREVKNLKIGSISSSSVELTWDEIDTATGYRIYYWKQLYQILTKDTNATNYFKLTGLKPSRKYKLYIVPLSGTQEGPQSQREEFVTAIGVPEAPTQVQIKVIGSSLMLSWNKPQPDHSPVISYRIECFESGERNAITKTVSADDRQAYITKGLQSLKYYTVKLVAVSTVGDGKSWQFDGIVLPEPDRPGKPDKPHVTNVNVSALNVTFVLPENYYGGLPDTYKVYYRLKGTDDNEKNVSGVFLNQSWFLLTNLHNKPYEIWTAGVNKLGEGASSALVVAASPKITPIERAEDEPFYKKLWFIILVVIVILLIVFLILVWIYCARRGGKHQVDKTEEEHSSWNDSEQLKNALETPMTTYETQERGLTKNTPM